MTGSSLFMIDEWTLVGEAPEILQTEIRGFVHYLMSASLYGVAAIRRSKRLELIINPC